MRTLAGSIELNQTWLNGKYFAGEAEINTSLPYLAVNGSLTSEGHDFFAQGEDADTFINEIHKYWLNNDCTTEEAFNYWINLYL